MQSLQTLQRNLRLLRILRGLSFAWFPIPTLMLFYQSNGLTIAQGLQLKTILALSTLLFEIPSGYLADICGRRRSLLLGGSIWLISLGLYCQGQSFAEFAIAEILAGLAGSLISGTESALAFDTLTILNAESRYTGFEGQLVAIAGFTEAVCGLLGAAIASVNLRAPFYCQAVCITLYALLTLGLIEPPRSKLTAPFRQSAAKILKIVHYALIQTPRLRWIIALSATFSSATFLIVWTGQAYLQAQNFAITDFGIIWAILHGVMSFGSLGSIVIARRWGLGFSLSFAITTLSLCFLGLSLIQAAWGVMFIAGIYAIRGFRAPLTLTLINQQVSANIRATVLSISNFTFQAGFILIGPLTGFLIATYSLSMALGAVACIVFTTGSIFLRHLHRLGAFSSN